MILKLFKYDFMDIGKKLFPFYIAAIIVSIVNRIFITTANLNSITNLSARTDFSRYQLFILQMQFVFYFIYFIIIIGISIMTFFVIITRFQRSIYGNEGYLTNTLPLTSAQIIFSKLVTFIIWIIISLFITIVSVFTLVPLELFLRILSADREFYTILSRLASEISNPEVLSFVIIYIISLFFSQCIKILILFLSIAIANLFKSSKIVIGIFSYLGISFVFSIIYSAVSLIFINKSISSIEGNLLFQVVKNGNIVLLLFNLIICVVLFFTVTYLHKNKLNLE